MILLDYYEYDGIYKFDYTLFSKPIHTLHISGVLAYNPYYYDKLFGHQDSFEKNETFAKLRRIL